jgi:hypothetical protein
VGGTKLSLKTPFANVTIESVRPNGTAPEDMLRVSIAVVGVNIVLTAVLH